MNRSVFESLERRSYFAVTASFVAESGALTVLGDNFANEIVISRDQAGHILVNGGAVPVQGGIPTVGNTTKIFVSGMAGADLIRLDEAEGALPGADLRGGEHNDTLIGGSQMDLILGEGGADLIRGLGGGDLLAGGDGDDTLVGGAGIDSLLGENHNDHFIWSAGDGSDIVEGGAGFDSVAVNGEDDAESFTVTANGARVRFDRLDPNPFFLDLGTTERLALMAGGGNDTFAATGNLAALIELAVEGGAGDDTLRGSNGADYMRGDEGNDFLDGQQGADLLFGDGGDDVFQWDPGDGNDTLEGLGGHDTFVFNGSGGNENISLLSTINGRLRLTRDIGNITIDADEIENVVVNALGGADTITVGDMSSTDVDEVNVRLSLFGSPNGDALADKVVVNGTGGADNIEISGSDGSASVTGLAATVNITTIESTLDTLVVNGLGGADLIDASSFATVMPSLTLDGGADNDTLAGSDGSDVLRGGAGDDLIDGKKGNDSVFLGDDDDRFVWNHGDGADLVEGEGGWDTLVFNGSDDVETFALSSNAGRLRLAHSTNVTTLLDGSDLEVVDVNARGGADAVIIHDLTGTEVMAVEVNLAAAPGLGADDGTPDSIVVHGTNFNDTLLIDDAPAGLTLYGFAAAVGITGAHGQHDQLIVYAGNGSDLIDASRLSDGRIRLSLYGDDGDDSIAGSQGGDTVFGGAGNDMAYMGEGNDVFVWNAGDGSDTVEGEGGSDGIAFKAGSVSENIALSANGPRVRLSSSTPSIALDCDNVESIGIDPAGGTDFVTIGDMTGTDVNRVVVQLSNDGQLDNLFVHGSSGDDTIQVSGDTSAMWINGLTAPLEIYGIETSDIITVRPLDGLDTITVYPMTGIDNKQLRINLEVTPGSNMADDFADKIILNGDDKNDSVSVVDVTAGTQVTGLGPKTLILNCDPTNDSLHVNTKQGADTITVNQLAGIGSARQIYLDAGAGTDTINVIGNDPSGAVRIMPSSGDDALSVNLDGVFTANVVLEGTQRLGSLSIGTGGTARLTIGSDMVLTLSSLSIGGTGRLDLGIGAMVLDYTGSSPIGTMQSLLGSGYSGGAWNGAGIMTSFGDGSSFALGYAEASDIAPGGTFSNQSVDATAILVKFTRYGDADLSGKVDVADLGRLASNWQSSPRRWAQGNFNFDAAVDVADLGLLASNWQAGAGTFMNSTTTRAPKAKMVSMVVE